MTVSYRRILVNIKIKPDLNQPAQKAGYKTAYYSEGDNGPGRQAGMILHIDKGTAFFERDEPLGVLRCPDIYH